MWIVHLEETKKLKPDQTPYWLSGLLRTMETDMFAVSAEWATVVDEELKKREHLDGAHQLCLVDEAPGDHE